jgi:SAM-dependent methyltransferase
LPYPPELPRALRNELGLDGSGRLLDVGCGPGSLALLLAPLFEQVVGVDADAGMVAEAEREAARLDVRNAAWLHLRAEELPGDLPRGGFRAVSFAQSFHWMDRERVAAAARELLEPGGTLIHVHATTHQGVDTDRELTWPRPPRDAIARLVESYLGPVRRAGRGAAPGALPAGEDEVVRAAGFRDQRLLDVGGGLVFERTEDEIVASVFSLASAAPHLFGDRLEEFESDLRRLLRDASPEGRFGEVQREVALELWTR